MADNNIFGNQTGIDPQAHPIAYSLGNLANIAISNANPQTEIGGALQNLGQQIKAMQQMKKRRDFQDQVNSIMGADTADKIEDFTDSSGNVVEGKMSKMYRLVISNPELAKEFGLLEPITNQYQKMKSKSEKVDAQSGVYLVHPVTGDVTKSGTIPKDSKVYKGKESPAERLEFERSKAGIVKAEQEKSKGRDLLKEANLIQQDVDELMGFLDNVPTGRVGGTMAELEKKFGTDSPQALGLRDYEDSLELFIGKIAKTFGGEVGVLTDRDIERIRKAFPKYWMTKTERRNRVKFVKNYIQRRVEMFQKKAQGQSSSQNPEYQNYLSAIGAK